MSHCPCGHVLQMCHRENARLWCPSEAPAIPVESEAHCSAHDRIACPDCQGTGHERVRSEARCPTWKIQVCEHGHRVEWSVSHGGLVHRPLSTPCHARSKPRLVTVCEAQGTGHERVIPATDATLTSLAENPGATIGLTAEQERERWATDLRAWIAERYPKTGPLAPGAVAMTRAALLDDLSAWLDKHTTEAPSGGER